jgi:hypothetical protein
VVKSTAQVYGETEVQGGEQRVTLNVRGEVRVFPMCAVEGLYPCLHQFLQPSSPSSRTISRAFSNCSTVCLSKLAVC